jgi:hypothetical protein
MEGFLSRYAESVGGGEKKDQREVVPPEPKEKIGGDSKMKKRKRKRGEESEQARDEPIRHKREEQARLDRNEKAREVEQERSVREERRNDPHIPSDRSVFSPEPESATTTVMLAPSFSGKTTLIVNELNKLSDNDLESYTGIVLFTGSISAAPLKRLESRVLEKMNIFDTFLPEYVGYMKKTNSMTNNRFRYLTIMDDCLKLKGDAIVDMILTLRNSGVSTVLSIQYSKLLGPAQRQSIHDYYIINLHLEDLEYMLTGFVASHFRDRLNEEGDSKAYDYNIKKLSHIVRERLKGRILHYDQRHDKINIYSMCILETDLHP